MRKISTNSGYTHSWLVEVFGQWPVDNIPETSVNIKMKNFCYICTPNLLKSPFFGLHGIFKDFDRGNYARLFNWYCSDREKLTVNQVNINRLNGVIAENILSIITDNLDQVDEEEQDRDFGELPTIALPGIIVPGWHVNAAIMLAMDVNELSPEDVEWYVAYMRDKSKPAKKPLQMKLPGVQ